LALFEFDGSTADYGDSIGVSTGKTVKPIGTAPALARNFDDSINLLRYIDPVRLFH